MGDLTREANMTKLIQSELVVVEDLESLEKTKAELAELVTAKGEEDDEKIKQLLGNGNLGDNREGSKEDSKEV